MPFEKMFVFGVPMQSNIMITSDLCEECIYMYMRNPQLCIMLVKCAKLKHYKFEQDLPTLSTPVLSGKFTTPPLSLSFYSGIRQKCDFF